MCHSVHMGEGVCPTPAQPHRQTRGDADPPKQTPNPGWANRPLDADPPGWADPPPGTVNRRAVRILVYLDAQTEAIKECDLLCTQGSKLNGLIAAVVFHYHVNSATESIIRFWLISRKVEMFLVLSLSLSTEFSNFVE